MKREQLRGLYVITDPLLCKDKLLDKVQQAITGGAKNHSIPQ
ncbi:MAG: hypothetical protein P8Y24_09430 [Gammaproteobacteria bacterium]